ncbi:MAG: hypothetical protein FIB05_02805 [Betaproteobacteria bacterium]|nr:hypothetical protein [Betaproteobacteria bacterium]
MLRQRYFSAQRAISAMLPRSRQWRASTSRERFLPRLGAGDGGDAGAALAGAALAGAASGGGAAGAGLAGAAAAAVMAGASLRGARRWRYGSAQRTTSTMSPRSRQCRASLGSAAGADACAKLTGGAYARSAASAMQVQLLRVLSIVTSRPQGDYFTRLTFATRLLSSNSRVKEPMNARRILTFGFSLWM